MPNAEKIRETLAVARANLPRLYMNSWASGRVNPNAASWQECGVTFCLAGWRAVLDGLRPQADYRGYATGRFVDTSGTVWAADQWAALSMDLTELQSYDLFVQTESVNDIDVLDWAAEQIIAGHSIRGCEDCDGDGVAVGGGDCETCEGRGLMVDEDAVTLQAKEEAGAE